MEDMLFILLAPWLVFVLLAVIACWILKLSKKHRGIALAFSVFLQMVSPGSMIEQTNKVVQVQKRMVKQKSLKVSARNDES